jgi:hypothetical protein
MSWVYPVLVLLRIVSLMYHLQLCFVAAFVLLHSSAVYIYSKYGTL